MINVTEWHARIWPNNVSVCRVWVYCDPTEEQTFLLCSGAGSRDRRDAVEARQASQTHTDTASQE
jgi:hypothetical protein